MAQITPSGQPTPLQPGEFVPSRPANDVSFQLQKVYPPSLIYIQRDDTLVLTAIHTLANAFVGITWRILQPTGLVQTGTASLKLPVAATAVALTINLQEGFLLSVAVSAPNATSRGQCFANVALCRGGNAASNAFEVLLSDYVTTTLAIGWPYGRSVSSTEGPGILLSTNIANPAAGADWTMTFGIPFRTRIVCARMFFAASATVANRVTGLQIKDNANNVLFQGEPNQVVVANNTVSVTYSSFCSAATANDPSVMVPLPSPAVVFGQWKLSSATANIQVGDQYSAIQVFTEQWFET